MRQKLSFLFIILTTILNAQDVLDVIIQNGCMDCHNVMGKKNAPAFTGISRKNKTQFSEIAKSKIENSIKNGSIGQYRQFTNQEMPSYSYLTQTELNDISEWILSLENTNMKGSGKGMGQKNMGNF